MIKYLEVTDDTIERVLKISSEAFNQCENYFLLEYNYYRKNKDTIGIIADVTDNGDIMGFCMWGHYSSNVNNETHFLNVCANNNNDSPYDNNDYIHLTHIVVASKYRNQKIGTKLLEWIINIFFDKNIELCVSIKNDIAIKLYCKFDFEKYETVPNMYEDQHDNSIYTGDGTTGYKMIRYSKFIN